MSTVIDGLTEQGHGGGLLGCPLMKVKITITGGQVHETDSNEIAFRYAAADAFNRGLAAAGTVLLEPIMRLQITTPEDHLGDFISDLQQRRAIITHTAHRGKIVVIEAEAPLASLFGYSSAMRGLSQGPRHLLDGTGRLRPRAGRGAGQFRVNWAGLGRSALCVRGKPNATRTSQYVREMRRLEGGGIRFERPLTGFCKSLRICGLPMWRWWQVK